MPHLTPAQLAAISGVGVWHALITEIVIVPTTNVLRFTTHYADLVIDGNTYLANSSVSQPQSTLQNTMANNNSTRIRVGLVDQARRNRFLTGDVRGARFTLSRVLIDEDTNTIIGPPLERISGVVHGYEVRDNFTGDGSLQPFEALIDIRPDTADLLTTPNVNTNSASQQRFNATDNIFSLVEASANKNIVLV